VSTFPVVGPSLSRPWVPVTVVGGAGCTSLPLDLRPRAMDDVGCIRHRRRCLRVKALTDPSLGFALLSKVS